jgi:hypothetical protein
MDAALAATSDDDATDGPWSLPDDGSEGGGYLPYFFREPYACGVTGYC